MLRKFENEEIKLNLDDYEIDDLIGSSGYSNVYKGFNKKTQQVFAFKFTSKLDEDISDSFIALNIMQTFDLPFLLKNYGYFYFPKYDDIPTYLKEKFMGYTHKDSKFLIIVNEFMPNGNLYEYLLNNKKSNKNIDPIFRYKIIFGIASIMKIIHSFRLFHRDLKPSHVFLNENLEPILSLCHTSKFLLSNNKRQTPMIGTPMFIAPEIINGGYYGLKADVYSFSIIILNMFTKNIEFNDKSRISAFNIYKKISSGERFSKPESIPDAYWNLIELCWKQDPDERPSFDEIVHILKNDEFISSIFLNQTDIDGIREYQNKFEIQENGSVICEYSLCMMKLVDLCKK